MGQFYDNTGGVEDMETFADMPRNRQQIYSIRNSSSVQLPGSHSVSNFEEIIRMSVEKSFVKDFMLSGGNPNAFLAWNPRLRDVEKFCCTPQISDSF